ncbi:peptidoglutaminase-asparaginase [Leptodontidium sp. MPI-SDFR-AT-0119]|nr:peptidoglutaminase-asparaginase [Leptodontidium sp. MPI-SDFR-AT-0119]
MLRSLFTLNPRLAAFAALIAGNLLVSASLVDNGKFLTLNSIPYYAGGIPVSQLYGVHNSVMHRAATFDSDIIPLAIIHTANSSFGASDLNFTVSTYLSIDDVFQEAFLNAVYVAYNGNASLTIDSSNFASTLESFNNRLFMVSKGAGSETTRGTIQAGLSEDLPNGPYFLSVATGAIFKAFRVYADNFVAFNQACISDEADGFLALPATTENVMTKSVAVPSRLYYTVTEDQPLAGLRLGVKDIYHVKGLRTSGGSRSYYYLYGTQNVTAPSVQRLIDQGAVLVGKTGTVQFANGDSPTADWVDLHCPFNPRGDGYQAPSGSSSGSGAAMGAYSWLDITVGSDTGGSMRGPAGSQGLFANRPSTGAISMEHVIPLSPALDTAGVFARSGALWSTVIHAWYENFTSNYRSYPKKLFVSSNTSGWSSGSNVTTEAAGLIQDFVGKLEGFLGTNRTQVNITQRWVETHPVGAPESVREMLNLTYAILTSVDQYNILGRQLFADYGAIHGGRRPFINPGPLTRWNWGQQNGGNASYQVAMQNMTTFRNWWETSGYGLPSNQSCSDGLYVYTWSTGSPNYRNRYFLAGTTPPLGFNDWAIAGYAGAPEVVVPLGEAPYNSTVSLQTEYLPVTVAIQAARGCDRMLASLVRDLEGEGILKPVGTGSRLYGE